MVEIPKSIETPEGNVQHESATDTTKKPPENRGKKRSRSEKGESSISKKPKKDWSDKPAAKREKLEKGECFVCGKVGHIARNCPESKQNESPSKNDRKKKRKKDECMSVLISSFIKHFEPNASNRLIDIIKIVNNSKLMSCRVWFDSGADISLLNEDYVIKHNLTKLAKQGRLESIRGLGGSIKHLKFYSHVKFKINELYPEICLNLSGSQIFRLARADLILGRDHIGEKGPFGLHTPAGESPYWTLVEDLSSRERSRNTFPLRNVVGTTVSKVQDRKTDPQKELSETRNNANSQSGVESNEESSYITNQQDSQLRLEVRGRDGSNHRAGHTSDEIITTIPLELDNQVVSDLSNDDSDFIVEDRISNNAEEAVSFNYLETLPDDNDSGHHLMVEASDSTNANSNVFQTSSLPEEISEEHTENSSGSTFKRKTSLKSIQPRILKGNQRRKWDLMLKCKSRKEKRKILKKILKGAKRYPVSELLPEVITREGSHLVTIIMAQEENPMYSLFRKCNLSDRELSEFDLD